MNILAVEDPAIPEVLDLSSGLHVSAHQVIGTDYEKLIQLRMKIKEGLKIGIPLYACSVCGIAVSLLMHKVSRHFFFRHVKEDGRCPQISRGELSREEINARKYNGAKESALHRRMKSLVAQSLAADKEFSDIKVEERWKGSLSGEWRQPDICATYRGVKIVFEIQLSTTYLDVIVERRLFYQREGALLIWIFAEFDDENRRLLQDDVFYNNNQNVFIVNEESAAFSISAGLFRLSCVWSEPLPNGGSSLLRRKMVLFNELTLSRQTQRAFFFDYAGACERIAKEKTTVADSLRERFEQAWMASLDNTEVMPRLWGSFRKEFRAQGVQLPVYHNQLHAILINAIYSAKYGRVVGWKYTRFIEVAHLIAGGYKSYLWIFREALKVYDRGQQLMDEDKSGRWAVRVEIYKAAIKKNDPDYISDDKFFPVLEVLFPELF
ncbi:hypothetical protein UNDYM_2309 [Undibacterium sp. YM2]|uniref:DUF6035 family protein n=1 Tax=Undibacterium sp. YM2 TaxID=2058625 RepID=UPI001331D82C|nr:DUF6035 family protein [Undibacterium sp. YM2]BBB66562.1 hypothetical protein UNDYM_2309 [Undibacterium sp. YM2]